jgi:hypothetical protein
VREADNLVTFIFLFSGNSGSLKLMEQKGPFQACIGTVYLYLYLVLNAVFLTVNGWADKQQPVTLMCL